ncbi:NADPH-dependent curcumin reductase [Methylacidimicrobium sp. AP8]|uniref:NADP-dependent oxidoreductase n=1 Tax=Methylacidimicrobium sp. AP8 TaxID=2730359 RepID=UPI0018BFB995|nr:NADP-dependent oxidoreductase [Methylacidimicrobium sp. AP8]CAB4243675.1 NADPH-dependent curcumin reductase [Methylacidimicrobium sp. AP8]
MSLRNRQVILVRRPEGALRTEDFLIVATELSEELAPGEILVRHLFVSVDPYQRLLAGGGETFTRPVAIGEPMPGWAVGEVVASRDPKLFPGDKVVTYLGWQLFGICRGAEVRKVSGRLPLPAYLGVAGMPGVTAFLGIFDIGRPRAGETVAVSAAAGAVGGIAGQLARMHACHVVGIAGGAAKCRHIVEDLGFAAAVDYKAAEFPAELRRATPEGIDVYFDSVGGAVLEAVLPLLNPFARIVLCGHIATYDRPESPLPKGWEFLLSRRVRLQGFIVGDRLDRWPEALARLERWAADGKLRYKETVVEGLENAPRALGDLLHGKSLGKLLVAL